MLRCQTSGDVCRCGMVYICKHRDLLRRVVERMIFAYKNLGRTNRRIPFRSTLPSKLVNSRISFQSMALHYTGRIQRRPVLRTVILSLHNGLGKFKKYLQVKPLTFESSVSTPQPKLAPPTRTINHSTHHESPNSAL
jgi:hypothetical protein